MFIIIRLYAFWTVLWGFLVILFTSMNEVVEIVLQLIDLSVMSVGLGYFFLFRNKIRCLKVRQDSNSAIIVGLVLFVSGIVFAGINNGDLISSSKYVAVLLRPLILILAVICWLCVSSLKDYSYYSKIVRLDLSILIFIQVIVASIQLFYPSLGQHLLVTLAGSQSSVRAFNEGDISGTFPNTIDLAYFLIASYVGISFRSVIYWKAPSTVIALILIYFIVHTGSLAATLCILAITSFLYVRLFTKSNRIIFLAIIYLVGLVVMLFNLEMIVNYLMFKFDDMMFSRLGLLFISLPNLVQHAPMKLIFGSGGDFNVVLNLLQSMPEVPLLFSFDEEAGAINDVFWLAMMFSFGTPIASLFLIRLYRIFHIFVTGDGDNHRVTPFFQILVYIIIIAGFLNQILAVRSFYVIIIYSLIPLAVLSSAKSRMKYIKSDSGVQ